MSFEHIIGHEKIRKNLKNSIENKTIAHAHLIVGQDGIGKSLIAEELALKLLNKDRKIEYADIVKWKLEQNEKSMGVKRIRDLIIEINKKPYEGDKKVIIVYNGDKMTVGAQNAFLKTIEEPPNGVFIFILCERIEVILDTIKSRCQIHKLNPLSKEDVEKFLKNKYPSITCEELKSATAFSGGIPGRAEKFIEDEEFRNIRDIIIDMFLNIKSKDEELAFKFSERLNKLSYKWDEILECILVYIRDIMLYKESGNLNLIINNDKVKEIEQLANKFSFKQLNDIINITNKTFDIINKNVNKSYAFDSMILRIGEV